MRCKKSLFSVILFMLLISMISFISAEIFISQPQQVYNLGDNFDVEIEVDQFADGYFDADLVCSEGETENLFHGVLTAKVIQISRQLNSVYIGNLRGNCYIQATYADETQSGESFKISDEIKISLELKEIGIKAGEKVSIKGKATKENGEAVNGFINVKIGNETKVSGSVNNGVFDLSFNTKQDMPSGQYNIEVEIYNEGNDGQRLNQGEDLINLIVKQDPSWIDIAIDKQVITPNQNIMIIPSLYDKANSDLPEELILRIISESGVEFEKIVTGGQELIYTIKSNHVVGYSRIIVSYDNLSAEKIIDVQEYEKISIEVINSTVIVKNIGNVEYNGPIEIMIGDKTIIKNVRIPLGGSKTYELSAPNGEYSLIISGKNSDYNQEGVALTGDAISINEIGRQAGIFLMYPLVWIFILLIIVAVIYVMYMNNKKKKTFSYPVNVINIKRPEKPMKKEDEIKREVSPETKNVGSVIEEHKNIIRPGTITKAEQVLVLNGQKQSAGIIDIKIKGDLGKVGKETMNNALKEVYEEKGVVSQMGNDFIIIFSPMITRTSKNTDIAVKVAQKIDKVLKEHNGKFREKISYGVSVNSGDIINRKEGDKLKFTNVGNTLSLAKRVAAIADNELLISKEAHENSRVNVKVDKSPKSAENLELFSVKKVIDIERNKEFIQNFLRKN